jgi:hypothetical protein
MFCKVLLAGGALWLLPLFLFPQLPYLPGWPQSVHGPATSTVAIGDLDDDGIQEVIFGDYSYLGQNDWWLYVKDPDGTDKPGWPINLAGCANAPILADLDDDGKMEIIKPCGGLKVWNSDGTLRWQYANPPGITLANASLADLDNDGMLDIVVTCSSGGAVFVFDAQGNVRPGWPVLLTRPPGWAPPLIGQSASIGDIDGDGLKEIVVGVYDGTFTDPSRVHCYKPDGTSCLGFPVGVSWQGYGSKAVLADIDSDGHLEIIIGKETTELNVYRSDGSLFPGYPLLQSARGIAIGDLYRNQNLGMVFSAFGISGYDLLTGAALSNFPFTDPSGQFGFSSKAPNICDLSDGAGVEIASGADNGGFVSDGKLFAFGLNGQVLPGYPSALLAHRALATGCAINDVDGDGTTDICCGSENMEFSVPRHSTVYCWDTGHPYNLDNVDWAMDGFDLGHTGRWRRLYHISKAGSQLAVGSCQGQGNPCYLPPDGSLIAVDVTAVREHGGANPAGQDVRYSRTLGCANYEGPVIDHGDGTYIRMLRAPTTDCTTNLHAWVNEFKLADYQQIIFTTGCVVPPPSFSLLSPSNHASNQPLIVTLHWAEAGVPPNPNLAVSYDLYFGPMPNPPLRASGLTATQYTVSSLSVNTRYFWKVVAKNACGDTVSVLWSFDTVPCTAAPRPFENLSPSDGAGDQPLEVELTWEASDQAFAYDVYLGTCPDLLELAAAVSGPQATVHDLAKGNTYYWKVIARNPCGEREGEVWSFTTACRHCRPVSPP